MLSLLENRKLLAIEGVLCRVDYNRQRIIAPHPYRFSCGDKVRPFTDESDLRDIADNETCRVA